jgi:hypothetical protein
VISCRLAAAREASPLDASGEQVASPASDSSTAAPAVEREGWGGRRLVPITLVAAPR